MKNEKEAIALLAKAENKLKTAIIDYNNGQYEDSISRSYYCAFLSVSALILSRGFHFSSHSQTIGCFNKEFVKTNIFPKEFTAILQGLFEDRQASDYDALAAFTSENAELCFNNAKMILESIKNYLEIEQE